MRFLQKSHSIETKSFTTDLEVIIKDLVSIAAEVKQFNIKEHKIYDYTYQ